MFRNAAVAAATLVLMACATENPLASQARRDGSFCEQLRYLVVLGTTSFKVHALTGQRLDGEFYRASFLPQGANECFIYQDSDHIYPEYYLCVFSDASSASASELRAAFEDLDGKVDSCLAREDWPGYYRHGESSPRFFLGSSSTDDERLYIDRYDQTEQSVGVMMLGPGGTYRSWTPKMKVDSVVLAVEAMER